MTTHSDTFTYSNGVLETVASSYWDDWPLYSSSPRTVNVISNAVYLSSGAVAYIGAMAEYLYTYASENVFSKLQVTTLASNEAVYVIVNCQDKGSSTYDGYFAELWSDGGTPTYSIYKVTNGSWNLLGSSNTSEGFSNNDYIEVRHNASDSIDMYHGVTKVSGVGGTDSTYSAARIGIGLYSDSTAAGTSRGDNWSGGDITAPTTSPPTSVAPTSLPPTSLAPTSLAPTSLAPTSLPPTSLAPTSLAPTSLAPTSLAPTSLAPTSPAPSIGGPLIGGKLVNNSILFGRLIQ